MAFPHPGCGFETQFVAKIIAVCDLVFGLVGIFWFVFILDGYGLLMEDPSIYNPNNQVSPSYVIPSTVSTLSTTLPSVIFENGSATNPPKPHHPILSLSDEGVQLHGVIGNVLLSGFYTLVNLGAFVLLLSGAHQKNILKLKIWFAIRLTIFLFKIVLYGFYICIGAAIYSQTPHIIFMAVHFYGLWVVAVFIKEIRVEQAQAVLDSMPQESTTQSGTGYIHFINSVDENKA